MKLTDLPDSNENLESEDKVSKEWLQKGYELPQYSRKDIKKLTLEEPTWLHFGAGNIFRAFPAAALQRILDQKQYHKGVVVCETFDEEIIDKVFHPYNNLSLLVVLKADGNLEKKVIGSIMESFTLDDKEKGHTKGNSRIKEIFMNPSLQMVSFTITEKGYRIKDAKGDYLPIVKEDLKDSTLNPKHLMGKITALLYQRYLSSATPIALVSMDNCSHNGEILYEAIFEYAKTWTNLGYVPKEFLEYVMDSNQVAFPWTMIDKITPRPDENVRNRLEADGFYDTDIIITNKNTYTAAFVNAEETEYLVIEDHFPNGRPPLEYGGIMFADRETVNKVEKMKVGTCLNPLHTALAIYGCLLSYQTIYEEMKDPLLVKLVEQIGYVEGMPVVVDPGIISPKEFLTKVITERLPNPYLPDTPSRIATDTSQKLSIRFGETLKAYVDENLDVEDLIGIPLVLAGYCRYLVGKNDKGEPFSLSPDPLLEELSEYMKQISLEKNDYKEGFLKPLLVREDIFGLNLYETSLGKKIESIFFELCNGIGAVANTLEKYLCPLKNQ